MQRGYDQKIEEFKSTGVPTIGSSASSSFRDGYYGRPCKRSHLSAAYACHMAGVDCRREEEKGDTR